MSFLTPAFLFGVLAAAVPILLHFMRRERLPRVPFSDLRLLRGARVDHARRLRLRELLLPALRAAALVLLALAFARPFVADRPAPDGPATVVLVDTSFSLSAPGQADEARALARAAIDEAPAGHLVAVVAFDDAARVAAGLTLDRAAARAAVAGLSPRPRGTRYREGLAAASALIGDRPGRVVVVTDLQAGGWDDGGRGRAVGARPAGVTGSPRGGRGDDGTGLSPAGVTGGRGSGDLSPPVSSASTEPRVSDGRSDGSGGLSPSGAAGLLSSDRADDDAGLSLSGVTGLPRGGRVVRGGLSLHVEVETRRVAPPVGNLAVVGIDREPAQTAVHLWRWGSSPDETRLTLTVDGAVLHDRAHPVEPGAWTIRLAVTLPDAGVATAAISDPAGYPADNRRHRRLDSAAAAGVLLVTEAGVPEVYLERALVFAGAAEGTVSTVAAADLAASGRSSRAASRGGAVSTVAAADLVASGRPNRAASRRGTVATVTAADLGRRPDLLADAAVVVLTGTRGLGRAGREPLSAFVRGGGGLLAVGGPAAAAAARAGLLGADAEPGPEAARVPTAQPMSRQRIHTEPVAAVPADRRHPVVRTLGELAGRLGEARFASTAAIDASAGAVVLSFTDGAPALVDRPVGAGRVLVFASDLRNEGNDLPRLPVFVPFLHEVVRYLDASPARSREFVVGAGPPGAPDEPGPARLPGVAGAIVLNVDTRESAFAPLTDEAFRASVERIARAEGSAPTLSADRRERPFPENAARSAERAALSMGLEATLPAERSTATAEQESAPPEEAEQGLWRYLLLAMAFLLVAEGLLAARTP